MGKQRFKQIFKGGYSRIFQLDDAPGLVCKRQEKFTAEKLVLYSTLIDAIFMSSLRPIHGTPIVSNIEQTSRHLDIYMKHHGQTLTQWMRANGPEARAQHAPHILHSLWSILSHLHYNGCMHTDLKPCNILVAPADAGALNVTLIDFNCMTVVGSHDIGLKYAPSIGTWSHAAPEIVFHEQPYPQSTVWSLALISIALYDRYPLPPRLTHDGDGKWFTERKSWRRILNHLMETHPGGIPVPNHLVNTMGHTLFDCVSKSLRWRPDERTPLAKWHEALAPGVALPTWHILDRNVDPTIFPTDHRAAGIEQIYQLSVQCDMPHWFCQASFLFDRCGKWAKPRQTPFVAATCWCLVGFLNNQYMSDNTHIVSKLASICGFDVAELNHWAFHVADTLDYNCWTKPLDVRLHEILGSTRRPSIEWLRDRWSAIDRPYTLAILSYEWAKDLKARPES